MTWGEVLVYSVTAWVAWQVLRSAYYAMRPDWLPLYADEDEDDGDEEEENR
jgi:hypothetical protein